MVLPCAHGRKLKRTVKENIKMREIVRRIKLLTKNDWIVIIICVALTFFLLFIAEIIGRPSWIKNLLQQVSSILAISGILTVILHRQSFKDTIDTAAEKVNVSKELLYAGLSHVELNYGDFDFKKEITLCNSKIDIYVIYASIWLKNNIQNLLNFAKEKNAHIRFCFLNPESPSVEILEKKFIDGGEGEIGYLKPKIQESVSFIEKNFCKDTNLKSKVEIYFQDYIPQYCIYRLDSKIFIIPYPISPGRRGFPLFGFNDTGNKNDLFDIFMADFDKLIEKYATLYKSNKDETLK